jgi:hypothetical protein
LGGILGFLPMVKWALSMGEIVPNAKNWLLKKN